MTRLQNCQQSWLPLSYIALKVHAYKNNFVIKSATLRTVFSCIYVYVVVDLISDNWRGSSYTNMWKEAALIVLQLFVASL